MEGCLGYTWITPLLLNSQLYLQLVTGWNVWTEKDGPRKERLSQCTASSALATVAPLLWGFCAVWAG